MFKEDTAFFKTFFSFSSEAAKLTVASKSPSFVPQSNLLPSNS